MGRRWGKTFLGEDLAVNPAIDGFPVGWFSPSYKMLLDVWRDIAATVKLITERISIQERRIELITGGVIEMWSLDNEDAGRGRKYKRIIIDEAAMAPNLLSTWTAAIRPTLTDYRGDAWFLSTPKGRNGFWQLYQLGIDSAEPDWMAWQMPTVTNPEIDPVEVEAARRMLPERVFLQEYEAQFLEDAGGVFRRVMQSTTAKEQEKAVQGAQYLFGVDWGKSADFTVIMVMDIRNRSMVYMDRFNQIDYTFQLGRLRALYERFRPTVIIAESNSMGEPLIEQVRMQGLPVQAFTTTNATKAQAIESLSLAFERGAVQILNDPILVAELQSYEMERLPSGAMRYSAPEGMHDDCVMSLAMAWHGLQVPAPQGLVDFA